MNINFSIKQKTFNKFIRRINKINLFGVTILLSIIFGITSTIYSLNHKYIISYGDAESHLNIAKRVMDGLTPGFAQLGGIWLPLPHLLMLPFISFDFLWQTGLAGSIVSGIAFIISNIYIYKFSYLLTKNKLASFVTSLVFITNPNILYMQSTPMTELPLIVFFILSSYYFARFIFEKNLILLIFAAFFGFCASLTRYDGWFLVGLEALILVYISLPKEFFMVVKNKINQLTYERFGSLTSINKALLINIRALPYRILNESFSSGNMKKLKKHKFDYSFEFSQDFASANIPFTYLSRQDLDINYDNFKTKLVELQGLVILFSTLAFFGILIWLVWGFLILGDPFYFTNSQFSAKTQQAAWLLKHQLPAFHNITMSFLYYFVTSASISGIIVFALSTIGFILFLKKGNRNYLGVAFLFLAPFLFNVISLFMGQSVIFIPSLTPVSYEWRLFNVRYGIMMVPFASIFLGFLFYKVKSPGKTLIAFLLIFQVVLYLIGYSKILTFEDGTVGLSAAKIPNAEYFMAKSYDGGMVLIDDYARTMSIIRSGIPMQNVIYVGTKPYWETSLYEPEKYATWIVMQRDDSVWKSIYENQITRARLYAYFEKVYTSPEILIFRRMTVQGFFMDHIDKAYASNTSNPIIWPVQSVDTMKISRDEARNPKVLDEIPNVVDSVAKLNPTHIAIATPYDEEFYPVLKAWVTEARKKNLKVWFRGNFSAWEGWFDYPKDMTPQEHNTMTYNFILKHPDLFKNGDIFTPAPEPENGSIGDPRTSLEKRKVFNKFLIDSYNNCQKAFSKINISVNCGYFSMNGDVAKYSLDYDTVKKMGNTVVIDHYTKSPFLMSKDIEWLYNKYQANIVIGEFGAPIPDINGDMTEAEQAQFVDNLLHEIYKEKNYVSGVNYWTVMGSSTSLYNNDGTARLAAGIINKYYSPYVIKGKVTDDLGRNVERAIVRTSDGLNVSVTDNKGEFTLIVPSDNVFITADKAKYVSYQKQINLQQKETDINIVLETSNKDILYIIKKILHFLRIL